MTALKRGFLDLSNRRVHWWRLGTGPAVVLLHGSPQSGAALLPLMAALASRGMSAIALDNPGNGWSEALPGPDFETADYVDAIMPALDALGLSDFGLYGFHTGASFACEIALRHPDRVKALVLEGLPIWTADERADMLDHYLPPVEISAGGEHMAWAWARIEEQSWFFPWHRTRHANRLQHGPTQLLATHANVMDLIRVGRAYEPPYASAFRFDGRCATGLRVPTLACGMASDPLLAHCDRLDWPPHVEIAGLGLDRLAGHARMADFLVQHPANTCPAALVQTGPVRMIDGPFGPHCVAYGSPDARRIALATPARSVLRLGKVDPDVILLDLPGHGVSAGPDGDWTSRTQLLDALNQITKAAGLPTLGPEALTAITPDDPSPPPDVSPVWDGAHLIRAWRWARRSAIFNPWDQPDRPNARSHVTANVANDDPDLDLNTLQNRALDLLDANRHDLSIWKILRSA